MEEHLTWDVNTPWKEFLANFCKSAYGDGAEPMQAYFLALAERQSTAGMEAGSYHAMPLIYDEAFIAQAEQLVNDARRKAKRLFEQKRIDLTAFSIGTMKEYSNRPPLTGWLLL